MKAVGWAVLAGAVCIFAATACGSSPAANTGDDASSEASTEASAGDATAGDDSSADAPTGDASSDSPVDAPADASTNPGDPCPQKTPIGKWQPMSASPIPNPGTSPFFASMGGFWTGARMLLFFNETPDAFVAIPSVIAYDPCADTWTSPIPDKHELHAGGVEGLVGSTFVAISWYQGPSSPPVAVRLDTVAMSWSPINLQGGPQSQADIYEPVFLNDRLLVFAAVTSPMYPTVLFTDYASGHRYDIAADAWSATGPAGAPARAGSVIADVGANVVVWSGVDTSGALLGDGYVYDSAQGTWRTMSTVGAPASRSVALAVSTGTELVVWGGYSGNQQASGGAIYNPATDTWRAMNMTGALASADTAVQQSLTVWTGDKVFTIDAATSANAVGALYDPKTDAWTSANMAGAPPIYGVFSAFPVATPDGKVLLSALQTPLIGAGIYDPATNSWSAVDMTGAPTEPALAEVWTGARLITWGGAKSCGGQCNQYILSGEIYRAP